MAFPFLVQTPWLHCKLRGKEGEEILIFFLNSKILSSKGEEQKKKSMAFSFPKRIHSFSMPKPDICPHGNPLTGAETQGVKSSELTEIGLSCHLEETCKNL